VSQGSAASPLQRVNAVSRNPKPLASLPISRRVGEPGFSHEARAQFVPTEAGAEFLARLEPILAALDEAEHSVREGGELRGLLPTSFGIRDAIPRLSAFAARHPNLHVQLLLEDRWQDLVRDAVDVAIPLGVASR
jgi:DNA-binding transcriptional LysR family regulator